MVKADIDVATVRQAFCGGGTATEITTFSSRALLDNYRYEDSGNVDFAIDQNDMMELEGLAEFCGRNKLAVHKPSQLQSAIVPCLTFDRNAHLAVYLGQETCGTPGHSTIIFRPNHGEETIDTAVIEQLISPIMQGYEAEGTAVFDAFGGATVKRLQAPDEILMFCVDVSASMRQPSDFAEVHGPVSVEEGDETVHVEPDFYRVSFEDVKEGIVSHESFDDMVAIVAETAEQNRRSVASRVLEILRMMLYSELKKKSTDLHNMRDYARENRSAYQGITDLEPRLKELKSLWAGLTTHEDAGCDFLIYRAISTSSEFSQRWFWSIGDAVPGAPRPGLIPSLDEDITDPPHHLRCPVSHTLMEDAVTASDGHTYSRTAISQWFRIRKSSPMTGLQLNDTSLIPNQETSDAAARWARGDGIADRDSQSSPPPKRLRGNDSKIELTFDSKFGSFSRRLSRSTSLKDLHRLAFRGLNARALVFRLHSARCGVLRATQSSVSSTSISHGDHISIHIAEDKPMTAANAASRSTSHHDRVLIKVYEGTDVMEFGYWMPRDSSVATLGSIVWKFWRYKFRNSRDVHAKEKQVWLNLISNGDELLTGCPEESTEMLTRFFIPHYCSGTLAPEKV